MRPKTSLTDVLGRFASRSPSARQRYEIWRTDPTKAEVVPVVEGHTVKVLYGVSSDNVISVCQRTQHALGDVRKSRIAIVEEIRDWHPAFAFTHVLHFAVEECGRVPTYEEFRRFCRDNPVGRTALWQPALAAVDRAASKYGRELARDAVRWRIGNAYYSFLRELFVLAVLREGGMDARLHPLADALFRVDFWVSDINLSLYIGSPMFRSGEQGRKELPSSILSDASPPFIFEEIRLKTQHLFGVVHLPERSEIEEVAMRYSGPHE